ncbi:hypothetical protein C7293_16695 [filamentous cyanobacterium CCT1]|nr:hypothetical protein C7293_16695 [filamentous cyanobacterium CCT1]PSN77784.1 hypothetical protein C8B47_20270 [filamentous cyanobacterium CCP4]
MKMRLIQLHRHNRAVMPVQTDIQQSRLIQIDSRCGGNDKRELFPRAMMGKFFPENPLKRI